MLFRMLASVSRYFPFTLSPSAALNNSNDLSESPFSRYRRPRLRIILSLEFPPQIIRKDCVFHSLSIPSCAYQVESATVVAPARSAGGRLPGHLHVADGFEVFGKNFDLCGRPPGQYRVRYLPGGAGRKIFVAEAFGFI